MTEELEVSMQLCLTRSQEADALTDHNVQEIATSPSIETLLFRVGPVKQGLTGKVTQTPAVIHGSPERKVSIDRIGLAKYQISRS